MQSRERNTSTAEVDPVSQKAIERIGMKVTIMGVGVVIGVAIIGCIVPSYIFAYVRVHIGDMAFLLFLTGLCAFPVFMCRCPVCKNNLAIAIIRYSMHLVNTGRPYQCPKCGETYWLNDSDAKRFWREKKKQGVDRKDVERLK